MKTAKRLLNFLLDDGYHVPLCAPLVFGYAAPLTGRRLKSYLQTGEVQAQCQLEAQRYFGYDAVFAYGGNSVETEALGCVLQYPEHDYPYILKPALDDLRQVTSLTKPDPFQTKRMPVLLKACQSLSREADKKLTVVGSALGPVSIAGQLAGLEQMIYLLADAPQEFQRVLEWIAQITVHFGQALVKAGADVILLVEPTASQNIFPATIFQKLIVPLLTQIVEQWRQAGAPAVWLMITGKTAGLLPHYAACGIDVATVDYEVPLSMAAQAAPELALTGNIRPYDLVQQEAAAVAVQSSELLVTGKQAKKFILGSGCEVPLDSRPENIKAMVQTAKGEWDFA